MSTTRRPLGPGPVPTVADQEPPVAPGGPPQSGPHRASSAGPS
ncbi:hypothetical protein [Streptomyces sp. Isolate_45]|nr:hypothetical protein [Streptomyces sp. Isolate_45]MDA5283874.1 hypothetical protein [Streptomyces sp. Isolate_45]